MSFKCLGQFSCISVFDSEPGKVVSFCVLFFLWHSFHILLILISTVIHIHFFYVKIKEIENWKHIQTKHFWKLLDTCSFRKALISGVLLTVQLCSRPPLKSQRINFFYAITHKKENLQLFQTKVSTLLKSISLCLLEITCLLSVLWERTPPICLSSSLLLRLFFAYVFHSPMSWKTFLEEAMWPMWHDRSLCWCEYLHLTPLSGFRGSVLICNQQLT